MSTPSGQRQSVMLAKSPPLVMLANEHLPTITEDVREQVDDDGASCVQMESACDDSTKSFLGDGVESQRETEDGQSINDSGIACSDANPRCNTVGGIRETESAGKDSRFLHFIWRCEMIEIWIAEKERYIKEEYLGRTLPSVHVFLRKQIAFNNKLSAYAIEGVYPLFDMRDEFLRRDDIDHSLRDRITKRLEEILSKWRTFREISEAREIKLAEMYARCQKADELLAKFTKKASTLRVWCDKAMQNLTSPLQWTSPKELVGLREKFSEFLVTMCSARADLDELDILDAKLTAIKYVAVSDMTDARMTITSLQIIWTNLMNQVNEREAEFNKETTRQEELGKMRAKIKRHGFCWLTHIPMFAPLRFRS